MSKQLKLIPVLNGQSTSIEYYIERKKNDNRTSLNIVKTYKKKLKESKENLKLKNKQLKIFYF